MNTIHQINETNENAELLAHNGEPVGGADRIELWRVPNAGRFIKWGDGAILTDDKIGFAEAAEYCTELVTKLTSSTDARGNVWFTIARGEETLLETRDEDAANQMAGDLGIMSCEER